MPTKKYRTLDVRPLLKQGTEPFAAVRTTIDALDLSEGLMLISPFLPSPLIEVLQNEGFSARPERLPDGSWQTFFTRERSKTA